jgi:dTDP-4-amino-4,6-dideoxygalactose transaminase
VIYDSAHAFGVTYQDQSIAAYGDVSVFSFHATKLFHTTEGGAIVSNHPDFHKELEYMRRFGHNGPEDFWGVGINGKNSEFHAAMGLCMLPRTREIIERYKQLNEEYHHYLEGICLSYPQIPEGTKYNYAYFPVVFPDETQLLKTRAALQEENIHPRRYFYPSLNTLSYVKLQTTPISEDISHRVLCLPLFFDLTYQDVQHICDVILKSLKPS